MLFPVVFLSNEDKVKIVSLESKVLIPAIVDLEAILTSEKREKIDRKDINYRVECSIMSV